MTTETSKTPFSDISSAAWYAKDVATAYEVGLVQGTTATTFSPDSLVSRQDLAVLLTRALTLTGVQLDNSKPLFSNYADTSSISAYAKESVQVLSSYGIIHGESAEDNMKFNPQKPATRETAVAALHQLLRGAKFVE
ncbi:Endo-1,4-beta-xylanase A precursor [compost metagenome]